MIILNGNVFKNMQTKQVSWWWTEIYIKSGNQSEESPNWNDFGGKNFYVFVLEFWKKLLSKIRK